MDYKKYSLENLENWLHDALSAGEASAEEVYNTIKKVVQEQYYHHKHHASQANELLALLNSGIDNNKYQDYLNEILSCDKDDPSPECKGAWNNFWEENYYPEEYKQYTEDELNAMCDKAASDEEKQKCFEYNVREAEYYNKEDKVKKWVLPVEVDGLTGDCFINLPDDLLEAANLKEGDYLEWVDCGDGTHLMKKVQKWVDSYKEEMLAAGYKMIDGRWQHPKLKYDEIIADGWTMTADGFWIKEN